MKKYLAKYNKQKVEARLCYSSYDIVNSLRSMISKWIKKFETSKEDKELNEYIFKTQLHHIITKNIYWIKIIM